MYDKGEREILDRLDLRELLTLDLLAHFIKADSLDKLELPFELIFDGQPDQQNLEKFLKVVARLTQKGIIQDIILRKDALVFEIVPAARSLIKKFIQKTEKTPPNSKGILCAKAFLALKRALGINEDAWYLEGFTHENFNFGVDISYLHMGFKGDRWRMSAQDSPCANLKRSLDVHPQSDGVLLLSQRIAFDLPDCGKNDCTVLCEIPVEDFTVTAIWKEMIPAIVATANESLEKARERLKSLLEVQTKNGQRVNKLELLRDMESVCQKNGFFCRFFDSNPQTRPIPEWPVDCERRGYFREIEHSLEQFNNKFLNRLSRHCEWSVEEFTAQIWLDLFKDRFGIEPDGLDLEDYGAEGCAGDLREAHPEKAVKLESAYRKILEQVRIRIAWGLYTSDFTNARAFVNAVLECAHGAKREELELGWAYTDILDRDSLEKCLQEAVDSSLR